MSVELFLETKILSSLYLRVMIQGWGEGTVLHDGNQDEVAIIYLYILKLKHYFFFYIQRYIAIYDYTAADDDEVSFNEGDIIVDATVIDEGWMEGRVQRSGQYGMLPSNYVEKI